MRTVAYIALLSPFRVNIFYSRVSARASRKTGVSPGIVRERLGGTNRSTRKEAASAIFPRDLRACRCCPADNQAIHSDLFSRW